VRRRRLHRLINPSRRPHACISQAAGVRTSTGRTGVSWDNAAESFFAALKKEMYYQRSFPDRASARFAVADYIEVFYNRRRLHSSLG
jgi:transposase InsO family protein